MKFKGAIHSQSELNNQIMNPQQQINDSDQENKQESKGYSHNIAVGANTDDTTPLCNKVAQQDHIVIEMNADSNKVRIPRQIKLSSKICIQGKPVEERHSRGAVRESQILQPSQEPNLSMRPEDDQRDFNKEHHPNYNSEKQVQQNSNQNEEFRDIVPLIEDQNCQNFIFLRDTPNHLKNPIMTSPDHDLREPFIAYPRKLNFQDELVTPTQGNGRDILDSRNQFNIVESTTGGIMASGKSSPWVKRAYQESQSLTRYEYVSPSKSPGWQPYQTSNNKRVNQRIAMHSADQPKPIQKSFVPYYGPPNGPQFFPIDGQAVNQSGHNNGMALEHQRLRVENPRKINQQLLISPMKRVSPNRDLPYQDSLGDQLLGIADAQRDRMNSGLSPNNMLKNLASRQAHIETPMRGRIDSQDSHMGVFQSLKCEEHMLNHKTDPQFQSPNVREKLSSQIENPLFAHPGGIGSITATGVIRSNQIPENQIQFLTPRKAEKNYGYQLNQNGKLDSNVKNKNWRQNSKLNSNNSNAALHQSGYTTLQQPTVVTTEASDTRGQGVGNHSRQMQTPILQSRKFSTFGSTRKILADSFLQTEQKQKRSIPNNNNEHGCADQGADEGRAALIMIPEPSDIDRNNQIDQSSAKKSSGLKCIAKQVIDIIKTKTYMSYPQVAQIVVQLNLKNQTTGSPDSEEGLCSQSNLIENDSCWWDDQSNLQTSAKKKRGATTNPAQEDGGCSVNQPGAGETPARRRSRQESNLRRRIYDAWNVLKAASIIVEHDEKHFKYNPSILKEQEIGGVTFDEEIIQERLQSTAIKTVQQQQQNNISLQASGSQTCNQQRLQTDDTDCFEHEREIQHLEFVNKSKIALMDAKFNQLTELVKSQIELKRLIKRNQKQLEGQKKAVAAGPRGGRKRGPKPTTQKDKKRVCKIPFIVVKYQPDVNSTEQPMILHKKQMKLTSVRPLKCYGDSTILSKMKLKEISPDETLVDILGPLGAQIPETFKRIDKLNKYFKDKYKQIGDNNGEQPCK